MTFLVLFVIIKSVYRDFEWNAREFDIKKNPGQARESHLDFEQVYFTTYLFDVISNGAGNNGKGSTR